MLLTKDLSGSRSSKKVASKRLEINVNKVHKVTKTKPLQKKSKRLSNEIENYNKKYISIYDDSKIALFLYYKKIS